MDQRTRNVPGRLRRGSLAAGVLVAAALAAGGVHAQAEGVDEDADRILHRMSDYLGSLKSFSFVGTSMTDVITDKGEKISLGAVSKVEVKRPDRLRSDREGAKTSMSLFYDGRSLALLGRRANLYAKTDAPHDLDDAINFARDQLGLEAPGADLLYKNAYDVLTQEVVSGRVVGQEFLEGHPTEHLAFRGRDVDFQIWIERGAKPLPLRYVITSKDVRGSPDFEVDFKDWNTNADIPDSAFQFRPPPGAQRINFLIAKETKQQQEPSRRTP